MKFIDHFKGDRNYIHATDELLAIEDLIRESEHFVFTSRKVGTCLSIWRESPAGIGEREDSIARIILSTSGERKITYECIQDFDKPIEKHVEFDEEEPENIAEIMGDKLLCPVCEKYTLWEHLSILQKLLLQKYIGHINWYLVRLDMDSIAIDKFKSSKNIELFFLRKKGLLYFSEVFLDGISLGEIGYAQR